jgi:ribosome biogenesis GTPase A
MFPESAQEWNNFERNLDVWRQLWRTLEASRVVVLVVDARMPLLHFPAPVYRWATAETAEGVSSHPSAVE